MEKIVFAFALFFIFFLGSCAPPSFIVVKNKGKIVGEDIFVHHNPSVYFKPTFWHRFDTDTIKLWNKAVSKKYKKYLYAIDKEGAKVILSARSHYNGWGDIFLIRDSMKNSFSEYSTKTINTLKRKFGVKNIAYEPQFDIAEYDRRTDSLWGYPSEFMKHAKVNFITYDINDKKDSFAFMEAHLYIPEQGIVWRGIHSMDVVKSKKNMDLPEYLRWQLRHNMLNWMAGFDTVAPPKIKQIKMNPKNPFGSANEIFTQDGYKAVLDSLLSWKEYFSNSPNEQEKGAYYQLLSTFASFAGDHPATLKAEKLVFAGKNNDTVIHLKPTVNIKNAMEYIAGKYGDEQVIMINEVHYRGQNRDFARRLLPYLYKKGFRYFAAETFGVWDSSINNRGYPVRNSGYYTSEPTFGQLVRAAHELGFKLAAYEALPDSSDKALSTLDRGAKREADQAKNLEAILAKDKSAKILVYAGFGHISKKPLKWPMMGELLIKSLHHDIPSIDCTKMIEQFNRKDENPMYRAAVDSFPGNDPFVLLDDQKPYLELQNKGNYDFHVFLPRTNYDPGYPDWMKETNETYYTLPVTDPMKGAFLQVYKAGEWEAVNKSATPVMQFIIPADKKELKLYLKKGKHYIFVKKNGQTLLEKTFSVD